MATIEGPGFTLTAEEPVAAFEVTLCVSGPNPKNLYVRGHINATARASASGQTLLVESLDRPEVEEGERYDHARTFELTAGEDATARVQMVADADLRGRGERCAEPEVIQFSTDGRRMERRRVRQGPRRPQPSDRDRPTVDPYDGLRREQACVARLTAPRGFGRSSRRDRLTRRECARAARRASFASAKMQGKPM